MDMDIKWEHVAPELRDSIERGVPAIRRINQHETFADWLKVGEALAAMQMAAQRFSGGNATTGRGYNLGYKVIAERVPDLAAINKTTRAHAIWFATNHEAITAWHERLPSNIRQQVNHPTTIKRRYERDTKPPAGPGKQPAGGGLRASVAELQEKLDAAERRLRKYQEDGQDYTMADTAKEIARVWFGSRYRAKFLAAGRELNRLDREASKNAGKVA